MSFFGGLIHGLGKIASNPLVDAGLSFIPGVGPVVAAGAHVLGGMMSGGNVQNGNNGDFGQNTNNKSSGGQSLDPHTQQQLGAIQNAYGQAGAAGPGPLLNGAAGYGTAAQQAGNLGFGALSGDPNAAKQLMNPYQQSVIDANNAQWQKTNAQDTNALNAQATAAGAFGGSRQGVAQGQMLANNAFNQQSQNAQLMNTGYQNAMNQASQLAGFGQQGAQMNANLGFGGVGNQALWNANMLKNGYMGPTGSTYSNSSNTNQNNGLQGTINGIGDILGLFKGSGSSPSSYTPPTLDPSSFGGGMF
jgi:hypothetical protein